MKLNKKKIVDTLKVFEDGGTAYQARKIANISVRRANEIREIYKKTEEVPIIGISVGRPKREILLEEKEIVTQAYLRYRLSASRLRPLIRRDYNIDYPHYHIHKILLSAGFAKPKETRDVRKKKWKRYERKHSLTAVHLD
jgi:putative transposase